ncbi:hypothetical protein PMG11_06997 [Penicillium brasilianum]|uniref:Uncharacterized protein n=1 Tax=Penicillium brasilianum TaxID=104259 RepID=A0A0F7TNI3_PENBI|nr:hypothetical protein PMG11_06997 [Penicillium brasilianum]
MKLFGRLCKSGKPIVRTAKAWAERFFGGFKESTGTEISETDRKEVYSWIKNTLTKDGKVVNKKKQKYNFTKEDFMKVVSSMWRVDHKKFIPRGLKALILFALQLYLFTGARVGSFMPSDENKQERGLRYEHIELVLFPSTTALWETGWKVNQKWLKNNRDSDYTVFGIGIRDSKRPQFASGDLLLGLALVRGALFGIETKEDLVKYDLSNGEIPLRWKKSFMEKPLFTNVTASGPQDIPLTSKDFSAYLHQIFDAAGYSEHPTIHCLRRNLAKEVEKSYGSAPVSQILAQKDPNTFPEHYQAHCSSIDTVSAILDEKAQTKHIAYFQGYSQFCEPGMPVELPAHIKESILKLPEITEIQNRVELLEKVGDEEGLMVGKLQYREALVRQRRIALKTYQDSWVKAKRDQDILNRRKGEPIEVMKDICTRAQYLIMPELARIAHAMSGTPELTFEEKLHYVEDIQTLCSRNEDVTYLPNEQPIDGHCPVKRCQLGIEILSKSARSAHIHNCIRQEKATELNVPESRLHFCYECMEWFLSPQWRDHCAVHLESWRTLHCEAIRYRHTIIRPAYCPFCLWDINQPAEERLQYWSRNGHLKEHIESQHLPKLLWPTIEPVCGCSQTFQNEREIRHHLHDTHGLKDAIWRNPKPPRKRKRACDNESQDFPMYTREECLKKARFSHYIPLRQENGHQLSNNVLVPALSVNGFIMENPEEYRHSRIDETSTSRTTSVASCFSRETSSLSSRSVSQGLEVIDPRILSAHSFNKNEPQSSDQVTEKPPSLSLSYYLQPALPPQPTSSKEDEGCAENRIGGEVSAAQEECTIPAPIDHQADKTAESGNKKALESKEYGPDRNYEDPTQVSRGNARSLSHLMQESGFNNLHRRLNARDRRKLLALKGEKMTLRQVGPQFAHLDTDFLRQVWGELKPFERCTRSRSIRKR